jgi:type VI secretion system protein ImpA
MPIGEDLLIPISGSNPSGENLRYTPIYDKIKEARRKEDPVAQGDWQRPLKEADYRLVIKLSTDALRRNTKDLQVAAWLTEALVYEEGISGLTAGLDFLHGLLEHFWDTVYPELEDGDVQLRAAPLTWVGEYRELEMAVRNIPLTKDGFSWFKYKESRTVGYEADLGESDSKRQARMEAINEGKLTAEEFDADALATSLADLERIVNEAEAALESLSSLDELCRQKFGDDAASFRVLRLAIEDIQHTARMLASTKREKEPQPEPEPEPEPEIEEEHSAVEFAAGAGSTSGAATATAPARQRMAKSVSAEPEDRDDAFRRIATLAAYLRREDPYSPVPYLILRALRWGELRASPGSVNPDLLDAPSTEMRQQLKRSMTDGEWDKVLETAESAMALSCGRGWLDLQRYVVRACAELGGNYDAIASAIQSELRILLKDFPQLPEMMLLDDTATANAETQSWLTKTFPPDAPAVAESDSAELEPVAAMEDVKPLDDIAEVKAPDIYELALEEARAGNAERALEMLARQTSQERSGRGRFLRRMQLAQICIYSNRHAIAYPILQDLAQEIDIRKLENWEQPEAIAQTLVLLLQSMQKLGFAEDDTRKIYSQICRLDPVQAARLGD